MPRQDHPWFRQQLMHLPSLISQALGLSFLLLRVSALDVLKDESIETEKVVEENIVKAEARWPENNPFANVLNGQQNYIDVLFENKTPKDVSVKSISGSFTNPKSGATIRNTTAQTLGISIAGGSGIKLPYAFYSEAKPQEARFRVFVDYDNDGVPAQLIAYDGVVTIAEPPISFLDWKLISTWGIVLALLAGGTYFTYLSFFPAPKTKLRVKTPVVGEVDTPITPGSGVYNEDWIPAHHIKRTKSGKKDGVLSSGDESERKRKR